MAGWSRVAAGLRSLLRSPRSLCATQVRRAVVPGLFGGSVATGIFLYYQYRPSSRTLPFTVYAEEQKVSKRFTDRVCVVTVVSIFRMFSIKKTTKLMENISTVVYRKGRKHRSKVLIESERPPAVALNIYLLFVSGSRSPAAVCQKSSLQPVRVRGVRTGALHDTQRLPLLRHAGESRP